MHATSTAIETAVKLGLVPLPEQKAKALQDATSKST